MEPAAPSADDSDHAPFLSAVDKNRPSTKSWNGKFIQPFTIVNDHVPDGLVEDGGTVEDFMTECCHRWLGALSRAFGGESDRRGGRRSQWDDCFSSHAKEGQQLAISIRPRVNSSPGGKSAGTLEQGAKGGSHKHLMYAHHDERMKSDVKVLLKDIPRSRPECFHQPTVKPLMQLVEKNASGLCFGTPEEQAAFLEHQSGESQSDCVSPLICGFQGRLRRLLLAYLHRHHSPGYGQGMTPVAAVLLACADCSLFPNGLAPLKSAVSGGERLDVDNAATQTSDDVAMKERQLVIDSSDNIAFWLFCHLVANVLPQDFYAPLPTPMHGLIVEISVTMVLLPSILPELHSSLTPIQRQLLMSVVFPKWFASLFVDELPLACTLLIFDKMYGEAGFDALCLAAIALLRLCSHRVIVQNSANNLNVDVSLSDVSTNMSMVDIIKAVCAELDVNNLSASIDWAQKQISHKRLIAVRTKAHGMIQDRWLDNGKFGTARVFVFLLMRGLFHDR